MIFETILREFKPPRRFVFTHLVWNIFSWIFYEQPSSTSKFLIQFEQIEKSDWSVKMHDFSIRIKTSDWSKTYLVVIKIKIFQFCQFFESIWMNIIQIIVCKIYFLKKFKFFWSFILRTFLNGILVKWVFSGVRKNGILRLFPMKTHWICCPSKNETFPEKRSCSITSI